MKRIAMLGAVALMGMLPAIASARTHVGLFFGFGAGPIGFGFSDYGHRGGFGFSYAAPIYTCPQPAYTYVAPAYTYVAPPVACAPAPVVYSQPQVIYSQPQVYYSTQVNVAPTYVAPPVVYAAPYYYPRYYDYGPRVSFYYGGGPRYYYRR